MEINQNVLKAKSDIKMSFMLLLCSTLDNIFTSIDYIRKICNIPFFFTPLQKKKMHGKNVENSIFKQRITSAYT